MADDRITRLGIRVKNWAEFQHYKDRAPAWIKLHRNLLDDYDWHRLPDASKALAPMLWLLASETQAGEINLSLDEISFRLRTTPEKINAALKPLISAGFFIVEQDASAPLAERKRDACSEEERETEEETEEEKREIAAPSAAADDAKAVAMAFVMFNEAAKRTGWPAVQKFDDDRKKAMRARLREVDGVEGFAIALGKAEASRFLTEQWPNFNLDWMLKAKNFRKLMEGNYDDRAGSNSHGRDGIAADFAFAANQLRDKQYSGV